MIPAALQHHGLEDKPAEISDEAEHEPRTEDSEMTGTGDTAAIDSPEPSVSMEARQPAQRHAIDSQVYKEWSKRKVNSKENYIEICRLFSGKTRFKLAPEIFNNKGMFRRHLVHLNRKISDDLTTKLKPKNKVYALRNAELLTEMNIEGDIVKCSAWQT